VRSLEAALAIYSQEATQYSQKFCNNIVKQHPICLAAADLDRDLPRSLSRLQYMNYTCTPQKRRPALTQAGTAHADARGVSLLSVGEYIASIQTEEVVLYVPFNFNARAKPSDTQFLDPIHCVWQIAHVRQGLSAV
jgi:hypothetical protein